MCTGLYKIYLPVDESLRKSPNNLKKVQKMDPVGARDAKARSLNSMLATQASQSPFLRAVGELYPGASRDDTSLALTWSVTLPLRPRFPSKPPGDKEQGPALRRQSGKDIIRCPGG